MLLLHFLWVAIGNSHGVAPEQMKANGELKISCGRAELFYMQGAWMLMRGAMRHVWAWMVGTLDTVLNSPNLPHPLDSNILLQRIHAPIAGVTRGFAIEIEFLK